MNEIQLAINRYLNSAKRRHRSTSSKTTAPLPSFHNSQRLNYNSSHYKHQTNNNANNNNNNSSFRVINGSIRSNATIRTTMISNTTPTTKGTNQVRASGQFSQRHHHQRQQPCRIFHKPTRLIRQQTLMSNFQAPEPIVLSESNESENKTNTKCDEADSGAIDDVATCGDASDSVELTVNRRSDRKKESLDQHNNTRATESGWDQSQSASLIGSSTTTTTKKRATALKQARINR